MLFQAIVVFIFVFMNQCYVLRAISSKIIINSDLYNNFIQYINKTNPDGLKCQRGVIPFFNKNESNILFMVNNFRKEGF